MAPQPLSTWDGTSWSDVDIPGEWDRRYGRPSPKRSDDDDDVCMQCMTFEIC